MTQRFSTPILLICAAAGIACGSERAGTFEPDPPVLTTLEVTPFAADLSAVAPGNTLQLTVAARDQRGALMPVTGATFLSQDPAIAGVSSSGMATAAAPGIAVIRATLTPGGITRIATIGVTVHGEYPDLAGVYDLTGVITGSDPAWGIADGTLQSSYLYGEGALASGQIVGTYGAGGHISGTFTAERRTE